MLASAEATMAQANDGLQRMTMLHEAGSLPEAQMNHGDRFLIHGLAVDIKQPVPMIPN